MTPLSFRFALRELRGGLAGFRIFLACLALGVAAIAAAGSTAEAFRQGLAAQAREILGGDLAVTVDRREFNPRERAILERTGQVAYAAMTRAMAQAPSGQRKLVELRGVSDNYPLAGKVELEGARSLAEATAEVGGVPGAAVERALLDKLGMKLGDTLMVGEQAFVARAIVLAEPDRLSRGFALGPRVVTRLSTLQAKRLIGNGLPSVETARLAIAPDADAPAAAKKLQKELGGRRFQVRSRAEATPGLAFMIDQLEYFLSFIGLASLIAGGLGVFGAVSAYLQMRRPSIAVLKALGGSGVLIRNTYLIQIAALALLGVVIGLVVGAAAPLLLGVWVNSKLPVPALFALYPMPLLKAAAFGLLSAAAFSLAPLARARRTPPAGLFRRDLPVAVGFTPETFGALAAAAGLAALALVTAPTPLAAALMIVGVAVSFVLLWLMGAAAAKGAGRLRGLVHGPLRLGLANLSGPNSAARTAAPAIGLGVALLASVVLIQSSLLREVTEVAPKSAPAVVYTEIPGARAEAFDATVAKAFGARLTPQTYMRVSVASGRIIKVRGEAVVRERRRGGEGWAYDNDLQMAVIGKEPPNAGVVAGRWWAADYAGPPLIAMDEEVAAEKQIKVGDAVTIAILGVELEARVAALRKIQAGGFGPNFIVVLNPAALEGAELRSIAIARVSKVQEDAATHALGVAFPGVNVISVREQLEAAKDIFDRLSLAIRAAAGVAGLAGVLVLAGAIAARARARTREAATLKVLGASRAQILSAYVLEYGAVGVIAGLAGVGLGYIAAWPVVVKVFKVDWGVDWGGVFALVGGAAALAAVGGVLAAVQALSKRPAPALRTE